MSVCVHLRILICEETTKWLVYIFWCVSKCVCVCVCVCGASVCVCVCVTKCVWCESMAF